jgi:hypothetical protein
MVPKAEDCFGGGMYPILQHCKSSYQIPQAISWFLAWKKTSAHFSSVTATNGQHYILKEAEPIYAFIPAKWGASRTLSMVEYIHEQRNCMWVISWYDSISNFLQRLIFVLILILNAFSLLTLGLIETLKHHSQSCK